MNTYPSLNVAVYDLRKRDYRLDFYYESDFIICSPLGLKVPAKLVQVDETYSFPSLHQPGKISLCMR